MRRLGLALAIGIGEYLALFMVLAVQHDGPVLQRLPGAWGVVRHTSLVVSLGACMAAAAVVFAASRHRASEGVLGPVGRLRFVAGHIAAYLAAAALVVGVFARPDQLSPWMGSASFVVWVLLTGVTGATLLAALGLPLTHWFPRDWHKRVVQVGALGALAYGVARFTKLAWEGLADTTLRLSGMLITLVLDEVYVATDGSHIIETPNLAIQVTDACSGIEGMGLLATFLAGFLYLRRDALRFPDAWVLLPVGVALAYVANVLRIAALVTLGDLISPEIAKGGFHSNAGWILFCGLAVALMLGAQRFFGLPSGGRDGEVHVVAAGRPADRAVASPDDMTAAYVLPIVLWLGTGMLTGALTAGLLDAAYALRLLTAGWVLYRYRDRYCDLRPGAWPLAVLAGLVVCGLWLLLPLAEMPAVSAEMATELSAFPQPWRGLWLVARALGGVVMVPVVEELCFRGFAQRRLIKAAWWEVPSGQFTWVSLLVTSLAFGALHGNLVAGSLAGACFAAVTYLRGRLGDAIVAHAVANGLLFAWALWTGQWAYL